MTRSHTRLAAPLLVSVLLWAGCGREQLVTDPLSLPADLSGTVADPDGRLYPSVRVQLDGDAQETTTDASGRYRFDSVPSGDHEVGIDPPLATRAVTPLPARVRTVSGRPADLSFLVAPQPLTALVNLGTVDALGEVRDATGQPPAEPTTELYARNVVDEPLGQLTPIQTPLGIAVTRTDWDGAGGKLAVSCDRRTSEVALEATGLIPNGIYSVWLTFLATTRAPGEPILASDIVRSEPLGPPSGAQNVVIADIEGAAALTVDHPSCVLTQTPALVVAVRYHLTGETYGPGPIPDAEEATHLLVYVR